MRLVYTTHARKRMEQRRISEADIRWVLFDPDDVDEYNGEAMAIRSGVDRLVKVVYEKLPNDTYKIITVVGQRVRLRKGNHEN